MTATFRVRRAKHGINRKIDFLDSEDDFRSEKNLAAQIREAMAAKFKQENSIGERHPHNLEMTIQVIGRIVLEEDRDSLSIENVE